MTEPTLVYRHLGFLASKDDLPFVADFTYLPDGHPDSTMVVFGLSLSASSLSFRQRPSFFEATYSVDVWFDNGEATRQPVESSQAVRVSTFDETRRRDDSIVFQRILRLPPGPWRATVVVRDEHSGRADTAARQIRVPDLDGTSALSVLAVHRSAPRHDATEVPRLLINPRHTAAYAMDTLTVYLEGRSMAREAKVALRILDDRGKSHWADTVRMEGSSRLSGAIARVAPGELPAGSFQLEATVAGMSDTVRMPLAVAVPGLPVVASIPEVVSLLRYFDAAELYTLRAAPGGTEGEAWHTFWRATDPDSTTPENEVLMAYFRELLTASLRFREAGQPGWLTDRGMVYLTLGPPDRIEPPRATGSADRLIRWRYRTGETSVRVLDFVEGPEDGRYRLTEESMTAFRRLRASRRAGA